MLVVQNPSYNYHKPTWKFILGKETYETRDVPRRVEVILDAFRSEENTFELITAKEFPEKYISELHKPYYSFIKKTAESIENPEEEIYPDLFPGEGAGFKKKNQALWGGIYCTDAVTPIMKMTYAAARGSAEAGLTGAELLVKKELREVYALCRPSGHHAGPRVFGGYCYFNNAATSAHYFSKKGTVAVLDIDYHHGNGTQEFFYKRKDVFTLSIHGDPSFEYPYFTGYKNEKGEGEGVGTNLNIPLRKHTPGPEYLEGIDKIVRALKKYKPDYFVIAAGFDTHKNDPIGGLSLETDVYPEIGARLAKVGAPTLICQEGGYNLDVLGECVKGFLKGFESERK